MALADWATEEDVQRLATSVAAQGSTYRLGTYLSVPRRRLAHYRPEDVPGVAEILHATVHVRIDPALRGTHSVMRAATQIREQLETIPVAD